MLKFALIGAGRIGQMHGSIIAGHTKTELVWVYDCLLYTSPSPRDKRQSRMPSSA